MEGCEKALVVAGRAVSRGSSSHRVAHKNGLTTPVLGKGDDLFSRLLNSTPGLVKNVLAKVFDMPFPFQHPSLRRFSHRAAQAARFCAGCPHRAAYLAVREVLGDSAIYPPISVATPWACTRRSTSAIFSSPWARDSGPRRLRPSNQKKSCRLHRRFHLFPQRSFATGQRRVQPP